MHWRFSTFLNFRTSNIIFSKNQIIYAKLFFLYLNYFFFTLLLLSFNVIFLMNVTILWRIIGEGFFMLGSIWISYTLYHIFHITLFFNTSPCNLWKIIKHTQIPMMVLNLMRQILDKFFLYWLLYWSRSTWTFLQFYFWVIVYMLRKINFLGCVKFYEKALRIYFGINSM